MLGRSYAVLGEPEKAAEAYGRAAQLLPDDPGVQLDHAVVDLETAEDSLEDVTAPEVADAHVGVVVMIEGRRPLDGEPVVAAGVSAADFRTCVALPDGAAVCACLMLAGELDGVEVTTIEGLATRDEAGQPKRHPVQQALIEAGGTQCGFCTPGIVMSAVALSLGLSFLVTIFPARRAASAALPPRSSAWLNSSPSSMARSGSSRRR